MSLPRLIGMVHLGALPGAPSFSGDLNAVVRAAVTDAHVLEDAGFGGVMIENFGDSPFYADDVPKVTVASMTRTAAEIAAATQLAVGVNVLRNDAAAALAVAAAVDAAFIRVNVLAGSMFTDQGLIEGKAAEIVRLRDRICPDVAIMADVFVKHAVPPAGLRLEDAVRDLAGRGGADAVVVSGVATGAAPDADRIATVKAAAGSTPVFIGSGADTATVRTLLSKIDGVIVGTAIKHGGVTTAPIDPALAAALVAAAG